MDLRPGPPATPSAAAPQPIIDKDYWLLIDGYVKKYRADCDTLLHLLAAGTYFAGAEYAGLWSNVVQRLLNAPKDQPQQVNSVMWNLTQYPTLLAIMTMLTVGSLLDRDDLVASILLRPRLQIVNYQEPQTAVHITHPWRIFDNKAADQLPRWGKNMMVYHAESHLMRADLDDVVATYESDPDRRASAFDVAEYLMALSSLTEKYQTPFVGEAALRGRYLDGPLPSAVEVRSRVENGRGSLVTDVFAGDAAAAVVALDLLDKEIERVAQRDRFR